MQIVINISEKIYESVMDGTYCGTLYQELKNGTPLPKGHGDLIDRSQIEYMKAIHDLKWGKITASECATKIKYSAPTIIEADRSEEDHGST